LGGAPTGRSCSRGFWEVVEVEDVKDMAGLGGPADVDTIDGVGEGDRLIEVLDWDLDAFASWTIKSILCFRPAWREEKDEPCKSERPASFLLNDSQSSVTRSSTTLTSFSSFIVRLVFVSSFADCLGKRDAIPEIYPSTFLREAERGIQNVTHDDMGVHAKIRRVKRDHRHHPPSLATAVGRVSSRLRSE
jgi:hypothetical protein